MEKETEKDVFPPHLLVVSLKDVRNDEVEDDNDSDKIVHKKERSRRRPAGRRNHAVHDDEPV